MHGLTDALKNARGVVDLGATILNVLKLTHFLDVPKENNQGDSGLVNNLARILVPAFVSIAQCITSGGVTEMGWLIIIHEPHASSDIQRDQPITG
jgi:hypothetical protein